jgi:hypothetical protein
VSKDHPTEQPPAEPARITSRACQVVTVTNKVLDYLKTQASTGSNIVAIVRRLVTIDYRLSFYQLLEQAKIKARWPVSRTTRASNPPLVEKRRVIMHVITFLNEHVHLKEVLRYVRENRLRFATLFDFASYAKSHPGDITDDPTFGKLMTIEEPSGKPGEAEILSAAILRMTSGDLVMDLASVQLPPDGAEPEAELTDDILDVHRFLVISDDVPHVEGDEIPNAATIVLRPREEAA